MEVEPLRELEKREEKREEDGLRGAVEVPAVCVLLRAVSVGVRAPVVSLEEMEGLMRRQSESPQLRGKKTNTKP